MTTSITKATNLKTLLKRKGLMQLKKGNRRKKESNESK